MSKCEVFSGPYFPAFGLNTKRYGVFLRIQFECGKIQIRNNSLFGHFSRSDPYEEDKEKHAAFSVNFAKILRIPILTEHLRWLPLVIAKTQVT